jgi:hypothetical protein
MKIVLRSLILIMITTLAAHQLQGQDSATVRPKTVGQLKKCLSDPSCPDVRNAAYDLAKREEFAFLLRQYKVASRVTRSYIVEGIYGSNRGRDSAAVVEFMSDLGFRKGRANQFDETIWYALQFLAERCDERALALLKAGGGTVGESYRYEVACVDWAKTLKAFGDCTYFKAKRTLLTSLDSSCLDVMAAAGASLHLLYPGRCMQVRTMSQATNCYNKLWDQETK